MTYDLVFDDISSKLITFTGKGGERDYIVDLTGKLKSAEILTTVEVISLDVTVLVVSTVSIGADGKSVNFHVEIVPGTLVRMAEIDIPFLGNGNTSDTYNVLQPIKKVLRT